MNRDTMTFFVPLDRVLSILLLFQATVVLVAVGHGITHSLNDRDVDEGFSIQAAGMRGCCEQHVLGVDIGHTEWMSLMECTNASSYRHQQGVLQTPGGIGLVTYATTDIWNYSAYSFAVNEIYSESHGYVMRHLDENSGPSYDQYDSRWNKVKALEEAIEPKNGWGKKLDWIVWLDADAIVLDMNLQIEKVTAAYPDAHILMSAEHAGSSTLVNSGMAIVKNSEWSLKFLQMWWTYKNRKLYSDQEQFDLLYKAMEGSEGFQSKIAILPPDAINSDPPAMTQQKPHNQVLHLMGEHQPFRVRVFESGLHELCAKMASAEAPSLQLGLSRENLHEWTLEEYGAESQNLLRDYRVRAGSGENTRKESVRVSNSVHHYAHALGEEDSRAQALRKEVFELVRQNLEARRAENTAHHQRTGKIMEEWPEHLKCLAEAGQHLLHFGPVGDRLRVAREVSVTLEEMLRVSHKEQHRAVFLMVAHMDFEEGLIHMHAGDNDGAVRAFQRGLSRHRELAATMGDHILISPLSSMASALCTVRRFDEALPMYEEAIRIAEVHVGRNHGSLGQHLLNFGISRVQAGDYGRAESLLTRALSVMETVGLAAADPLVRKCGDFLRLAQGREGALPPPPPPLPASLDSNEGSEGDALAPAKKLAFRRKKEKTASCEGQCDRPL